MADESSRSDPNRLARITVAVFLFIACVVIFKPRGRDGGIPVPQNAQFHSMEAALELFNNLFDGYPPSDANDPTGKPYCGAMKLAEAMMGRDLLGFHKDSVFRADGKAADGATDLYLPTGVSYDRTMNLRARKGPFLPPEPEIADCLTLARIYGEKNTGAFDPDSRVLCDTYKHKYETGHRGGMPVLYYKGDTSKTAHDVNNPNNPDNMYDYRDNHALLALGVPGDPKAKHPLYTDPKLFYRMTKSDKITTSSRPVNADTYILISAGKDGLYGTEDDISNFYFRFPKQ